MGIFFANGYIFVNIPQKKPMPTNRSIYLNDVENEYEADNDESFSVAPKSILDFAGIKGTVFFLRGHGRWSFIHSNPKIVLKKNSLFFIFPAEKFIGHLI